MGSNNYWEQHHINSRRSAKHPIVQSYAKNKLDIIYNSFNTQVDTCLEIGAGDGFFSLNLAQRYDLTMIDTSKEMLRRNPVKDRQLVMDCEALSFNDDSFDLVFEANVLHHAENTDRAILEMKRVSKKYLVFVEPNRNNIINFILGLINKDERKSLKYSMGYLKGLVENHALRIVRISTHVIYPPNKCPRWYWSIFKKFDFEIPIVGFENIIVCEKVDS